MSLSIFFEDAKPAALPGERLESLASRVEAILKASEEPLSVRAVGKLAAARRQDVAAALRLLREDRRAFWRPGRHGAHLWRSSRRAE